MKKIYIAAFAAAALAAASCSDRHNGWSIEGTIAGADGCTLYIEGFNNGIWYVADSVKAQGDKFIYQADAPAAYPDIMRLSLGDRHIYFPVDSVDRITVTTDTLEFGRKYTLDGSMSARTIKAIDSIVDNAVAEKGIQAVIADKDLKRSLFAKAYEDPSVVSVYYLVNKSVGNLSLFATIDPSDVRYYGAVAQRFATERPDDPRGAYMSTLYTRSRQLHSNAPGASIEVPEASLLDITRADAAGRQHSLAEMASKGGVTVLSFTAYGMENSPAYNALLFSVYDKYKDRGLGIYQIAFDENETLWRQTAVNLPWVAVWNTTTGGNKPLVDYNVSVLPTTFIINRNGELVERVADPAKLEAALAKYI